MTNPVSSRKERPHLIKEDLISLNILLTPNQEDIMPTTFHGEVRGTFGAAVDVVFVES